MSRAGAPLLASLLLVSACGQSPGDDPVRLARSFGLTWSAAAPSTPAPLPPVAPAASLFPITTQLSIAGLAPTSGFPLDGCWLATSDGSFEARLDLRGGPTRFRLRLKAVREVGDWPSLRVLLDGREIAASRLDQNLPDQDAAEPFLTPRYRWVEVAAQADASPGPAILRVEYACSGFDPVERIGIRGIFFDRLLVSERPSRRDGCPATSPGPPERKVLLIGLDGASWSVILPLVNRGLLPNIAGLMQRGAYGPLDSEPRTYSPAVWNTIYTGQPRSVHGIDQMSMKTIGSPTAESHSTRSLRAATLWQMCAARGRSAVIVGMHTTWPAQPVRGVLVSDRTFVAPVNGGVWPPDQQEPVQRALASLVPLGRSFASGLPPGLRAAAGRDACAVALARGYLTQGQPDLAAVYLTLPDHAGHLLWSRHAPFGLDHRFEGAVPRSDPGLDDLERAYVLTDELAGKLLASIDARRTTVIVVSDHSCDVADPVTARRYRLSALVKAATGGKAYIPFEESWIVAQIYLAGRSSDGSYDEQAYRTTADTVRETLLALRTSAGKKLFDAVAVQPPRTVRPGSHQPADLVGILNANLGKDESVRLPDGSEIPLVDVMRDLGNRTGTHDRFGILVMDGAGVRGETLVHAATIRDVAPTVLALLGMPRGADLPGRPLEEALAGEVRSPCFVASYKDAVAPAPAEGREAPLTREELERLRGLGYVQ